MFIDQVQFFQGFDESDQAYLRMRDKCEQQNQRAVFEKYFLVPDLERQHQNEDDLRHFRDSADIFFSTYEYNPVHIQPLHRMSVSTNSLTTSHLSINRIIQDEQKTVYKRHYILETAFSGMIEVSSFFDFGSDAVILYHLARGRDSAWFTFAIFTILCPYYTVYTSLMTFQLQRQRHQTGCFGCHTFFKVLSILPTMLLFLIVVDLCYMLVFTITLPIIFVLTWICPHGEVLFNWFDNVVNRIF